MIENLYRSPTDKWLGGVAVGLAERFKLPTIVVRVLLVIGAVFMPVILPVIYLVLWVVLPESSSQEEVHVVVDEVAKETEADSKQA